MRGWARPILTTVLVAGLPVATGWALWAAGVVTSLWIITPLVVALALLASFAGAAYWQRRPATGDVLYSDLLLWGWLRRARAEHQLADAVQLLERVGADDEGGKLRLLTQLAAALDAKDPYLDGHSHRVARYSSLMAHRLNVPREEAVRIRTAAAVHDVGKLHVPGAILTKPDRLTVAEEEAMQRHAGEGAAMVECLSDPELADIVHHHHERFDGGGYPAGLAAETIPLGARIVAVADTFDAITSARPYRPAGTHKYALDALAAGAGTQLDPVVVRAFLSEYAGRRGVALWALLTLPIARARRHPVPVGAVMGGLLIAGAAATALQLTGGGGSPPPSRARAARIAPPAGPTGAAAVRHSRARTSRAHTGRPAPAVVAATTGRTAPAATLVAAVSRPEAHRRRSAAQRAPAAARPTPPRAAPPAGSPPPTSTPRPAAPAPRVTPAPATPAPAATSRPPATPVSSSAPAAQQPPVTAPPAPAPAAATPAPAPAAQPTPTAPPPAAQNCKNGGYVALGDRNQGQCVSSQHGP